MQKLKLGTNYESDAILEDAECTNICIYMSLILLLSCAIYQYFKIPYIDSIGTLGLAYLSWHEGKECFEKANKKQKKKNI